MKSNINRRVSTHTINTVLVIAVLCIAGITTSCRDEFYYGKNDSKKTFSIPNQSLEETVVIGDSVTGFLYSDFQYKYYKVHNSGKDFQINVVDYKTAYDDKYCMTTVMTTYSEQSTYGTTITRNGNAYKISSSSEYTYVTVETTGSETTGYYAFKFSEITCDEIIINDPAKTFYLDMYNSSYSKKIQINGVANTDYYYTFSQSNSASSYIVNSSGSTILSGSGSFTFPSDGKPCYIIVSSYYSGSFTAKVEELTDGKTDAISIISSRNRSYIDATTYHSNDSYPSQWYKFYGTPGVTYVIQSNSLFYYYSVRITNSMGSTVSKIGQKFTMPPYDDFVYIKMSYTYGSSSYSSNNFYIYPETSVQANALSLSLNKSSSISLSSNDYLEYDEVYGSTYGKYIRWYKFDAIAGKKYTFTFDYYSSSYSDITINSGLTSVASINYNDVVSYTSSTNQTLYLKIESYYTNTIMFTSKEE